MGCIARAHTRHPCPIRHPDLGVETGIAPREVNGWGTAGKVLFRSSFCFLALALGLPHHGAALSMGVRRGLPAGGAVNAG